MPRPKGSKNKPKKQEFEVKRIDLEDEADVKTNVIYGKLTESTEISNEPTTLEISDFKKDPQELLNNWLEFNGIKLDFDVIEGPIPTKYGIIKLTEPTLVVKASYV